MRVSISMAVLAACLAAACTTAGRYSDPDPGNDVKWIDDRGQNRSQETARFDLDLCRGIRKSLGTSIPDCMATKGWVQAGSQSILDRFPPPPILAPASAPKPASGYGADRS